MATYESLGVKRIVNASANNSKAGSSCLSPQVSEAMRQAAESFVDMDELHLKCGAYIASITGAEDALITTGACGGLLLAVSACVTGSNIAKMLTLPYSAAGYEVIVQKGHRSGYDQAVSTVGVNMVEVGLPFRTLPQQIEDAINEHTVAILFTIGEFICPRGEVSLSEVIRIGKKHNIPVILDGSLIIFPFERLQNYINLGVDLLVTSGGKHVGGPPGTGFLCGNQKLVEACRMQAGPAFGIGRPLKVGKEEMMGLITALEIYLQTDQTKVIREWKQKVEIIHNGLQNLPYLTTTQTFLDEVDRPVPRVCVKLDEEKLGISAFKVAELLRKNPPHIWVQEFNLSDGILWINPVCLADGDELKIIDGIKTLWKEIEKYK